MLTRLGAMMGAMVDYVREDIAEFVLKRLSFQIFITDQLVEPISFTAIQKSYPITMTPLDQVGKSIGRPVGPQDNTNCRQAFTPVKPYLLRGKRMCHQLYRFLGAVSFDDRIEYQLI